MNNGKNTLDEQIGKAIAGDRTALAELFEQHRDRLRKMLLLRMDPRVQGRLDVSDVLQETYIEAARQIPEFVKESKMPFFLWLRLLTGQRLAKAHRKHLGTAKRKAQREVSLASNQMPQASSLNLASHLVGCFSTASKEAMRSELRLKVQAVLDEMETNDQEVLALRHFEEMTIQESAIVLEISETAASSRYRRALLKIKQAFEQVPGLLDDYTGSSPK